MNIKLLIFSAASLISAVSGQPPELPECADPIACVTPPGGEGFFVCRIQEEMSSLRPTGPPSAEGRHGGGRGRGDLSRSMCAPVDPPEEGEGRPDRPPFAGDGGDRPRPRLECGCCDDVCPIRLDCGCTCDIIRRDGTVDEGAGVKVTIIKRDGTEAQKCLPPIYADEGRATCIEDCSVVIVAEEEAVEGEVP